MLIKHPLLSEQIENQVWKANDASISSTISTPKLQDHLPFIPPIRRRLKIPLLLISSHRIPLLAARAICKILVSYLLASTRRETEYM